MKFKMKSCDDSSYVSTVEIEGKTYKIECKKGIIDTKEKVLIDFLSNHSTYIPIAVDEVKEKDKDKDK